MPLTTLEVHTINRSFMLSLKVLNEVLTMADLLNTIYNATGGCKDTITQEGMDERPEFSGLTKTQLDDGMYALTGAIRTSIDSATTALSQLAARVPG